MTQNEALAILESGASVLLSGAAGTGKTYVLNEFVRRAKREGKSIAVTATTGLAATHLNGTTIHAWSGIGVRDELDPRTVSKLGKQRQELINKADVLVIDEISMLHDFRLDMVDEMLRLVREKDAPFGGIQVVLSGDFFQLPPVNRADSRQGSFVTNSQVWAQNVFTVCYLEKQFRQSNDQAYTDILNGIRAGVLTRNQLRSLQDRATAIEDPFTTQTRLMTVNVDVDEVNERQLAKLEGDMHEYEMETAGSKQYLEQLQRSCLAPQTLRLKKGAHVMCIKNSQDRKYVNGTLGVVVAFEKGTDYPVVALNNGREITIRPDSWELMDGDKRRAQITQLPLRLAWAITVHKSQGMTLDAARVDLSRAFVEGMGYVALSRVKSMEHLILDGLNGMALRVSPLAREIDTELRTKSAQAQHDFASVFAAWEEREANRAEDEPDDRSASPKANAMDWQAKLAKMREQYPNAYRPWSKADDTELKKKFDEGALLSDLTAHFGRHPGSIKKRLEKYFGEDVVVR